METKFKVGDKIRITKLYSSKIAAEVILDTPHKATIIDIDVSGEYIEFAPPIFDEDVLVTELVLDEFEVIETDSKGRACEDKPTVYLAGDMLSYGAQLQRKEEAKQLRERGAKLYVPHEDKSINDKASAVQEGLAERIVENDTKGIVESDIVVIDVHENGKGTLVELGQIKGMRDKSWEIVKILDDYLLGLESPEDVIDRVVKSLEKDIFRKVLPHNTDIRRQNTSEQSGDRREYGVNQYVLGVALDLTLGHGFYELDEIYDEVERMTYDDTFDV